MAMQTFLHVQDLTDCPKEQLRVNRFVYERLRADFNDLLVGPLAGPGVRRPLKNLDSGACPGLRSGVRRNDGNKFWQALRIHEL